MIKYGTDKHHVTLLQELFNFREKEDGQARAEPSVVKGSCSASANDRDDTMSAEAK